MQNKKNTGVLFLINPHSGRRRSEKTIRKLKQEYPSIDYSLSSSEDDFRKICLENIEKYTCFIVAGGDGTIHTAVNFFYHYPDKILGVYPAGSGNGFANEMGFTNKLKSLIEAAESGKYKSVDVLDLNGIKCINVAGVGLDSYVAHRFSESSARGLVTYIRLTIKSVFQFKAFPAKIRTGTKEHAHKYLMISIANTRQFGNNALIAPRANPSDGQFDIVLVKTLPFYLYPLFVFRLFNGNLKNSKYIQYITTSSALHIDTDLTEFHVDGEPLKFTRPVTVTMEKEKLKILAV